MLNFTFQNPCKIVFGKDEQKQVGKLVKEYSSHVLMVYGRNSIKTSGLYDQICDSLKAEGIEYVELPGVKGNPEMDLVYEGIDLCRKNGLDFVLAVGGGSVIDTSKAISVGVPYDGDVWDFYLRKCKPTKALPIGTVLTVVGAGSEMSCSNVVTKADEKLKRDFDNQIIIPRFSILNPELTYTVSSYQTACGSFDALTHVMERYFTQVEHTDVTDRLCEGLMKTIIAFTPLAQQNPDNYDYRAEIMWAATLAQNNLMSTGRDGDWACHKIEHELSGEFDIAHGEGLAMLFPTWIRYVYKSNPERIRQFGRRVFDIDLAGYDDDVACLKVAEALEDFEKKIGLKTDMSSLGIDEATARMLAERCCWNAPTKGKFRKLDPTDIAELLMQAAKVR
ncbi:MAG: iron-containing alcohol dehydrogenase [Erysipelotrichaceae bacterium]|nr:iron-containing alcohol dehydrogenase [Erysipelotrichaceae bacterium]MBR2792314.1 iron-containing alcohol dehydrogenase [Erysipelotrichaceae bacterium]MBR2827001.1 iron-containing alcohol dehydrogenase [Erysipelotrichaceae bacterium]MBR6957713.1 iron-containing alcohol dehydrogenase [Erysipelotrichaceae bacterium]